MKKWPLDVGTLWIVSIEGDSDCNVAVHRFREVRCMMLTRLDALVFQKTTSRIPNRQVDESGCLSIESKQQCTVCYFSDITREALKRVRRLTWNDVTLPQYSRGMP